MYPGESAIDKTRTKEIFSRKAMSAREKSLYTIRNIGAIKATVETEGTRTRPPDTNGIVKYVDNAAAMRRIARYDCCLGAE